MKYRPVPQLLRSTLDDRQVTWAIRFLFIGSVVLIVILSTSYHSVNQELIFYSEKVDHTNEVIDQIQAVRYAVYETTYSGRGFLVLGDAYNRALMLRKVDQLIPLVDSLGRLVDDNDTQGSRIVSIREVLNNYKLRIVRFAKEDPLTFDMAHKKSIITSGAALTESINTQLTEMQNEESLLRLSRTENRDGYKRQIFRFNWLIMSVALVLLASSFLLLERQLRTNARYKRELESQIENLNRSGAELAQFAYIASHDLQEPLRKIRAFADMIKTKAQDSLDPLVVQMLTKIDGSAVRMQMLIDDLLLFSRSADSEQEAGLVDLNEVLHQAQAHLADSLHAINGKVVAKPLPVVLGHTSQLTQLFHNLLTNSIKFHSPSVALKIDIFCKEVVGSDISGVRPLHEDQRFHLITFRDNGIGFEDKYAEKIFVIFQRLHNSEQFEGSGIGLAICRKVVANHQGYLLARGTQDAGAEFCIYLPK